MKHKTLILVFLSSLLLVFTGCSGSGNTDEALGLVLPEANYTYFTSDDISIQYPRNWEVLQRNELSSKYEANLEVAFKSNFKDLFFTPVISIEKIKADETKTLTEVSDNLIAINENSLLDYLVIEKQTISTVVNNDPVTTTLIRFQAKEKLQDDTLEYIQTYLKDNGVLYVVTAVYDPTDNNTDLDKIVNSLRSFKLQ